MPAARRSRRFVPGLDRVEGRNLPGVTLSGLSLGDLGNWLGHIGNVPDLDAAGLALLRRQIAQGAGREFVRLIDRTPGGQQQLIDFFTKKRASARMPGFYHTEAKSRAEYAGSISDQINPLAAGAVVVNRRTLSLASMMRGPIDIARFGRYVWALDTGRGAQTVFDVRPRIKADTLVAVERSADGSVRVLVEDLVNGTTRELSSRKASILGPTVRVKLNPLTDLPGGASLKRAKFAFWVQDEPAGADSTRVTRFLPDTSLKVGRLIG